MRTIDFDIAYANIAVRAAFSDVQSHVTGFDGGYRFVCHGRDVAGMGANGQPSLTVQAGLNGKVAAVELRV